MTEADGDAVLRALLEPALLEGVSALADGMPTDDDRRALADRLAAAAEDAQAALGERAREARIHRIVGAAASASMALALGGDAVPAADIARRLQEGLRLLSAGSWPPEDQDPAE